MSRWTSSTHTKLRVHQAHGESSNSLDSFNSYSLESFNSYSLESFNSYSGIPYFIFAGRPATSTRGRGSRALREHALMQAWRRRPVGAHHDTAVTTTPGAVTTTPGAVTTT
jgi:hypothetical protein